MTSPRRSTRRHSHSDGRTANDDRGNRLSSCRTHTPRSPGEDRIRVRSLRLGLTACSTPSLAAPTTKGSPSATCSVAFEDFGLWHTPGRPGGPRSFRSPSPDCHSSSRCQWRSWRTDGHSPRPKSGCRARCSTAASLPNRSSALLAPCSPAYAHLSARRGPGRRGMVSKAGQPRDWPCRHRLALLIALQSRARTCPSR